MPFSINIEGHRFGRLIALALSHSINRKEMWECRCDCGIFKIIAKHHLRSGAVISCGCVEKERIGALRKGTTSGSYLRHGHYRNGRKTRELEAYDHAKRRCQCVSSDDYQNYGGRGIEFRFASFQHFLIVVGSHPGKGYTLGRINNDGHYEAGNVEWQTYKQQNNNRRPRRKRYETV